ncbi:hypothetical protein HDR59_05000 [bacterium]|nr:hypothetical protein [bacterium]
MRKVSLLTLASIAVISSAVSAQRAGGMYSTTSTTTTPLFNMESPFYKPTEGVFYSKTNFNYNPVEHHDDTYQVTEEFGYGIDNQWTIAASIGYGWMDKNANFYDKGSQVSNLAIGGSYRPVMDNGFIWDIKAGVNIDIADDMVQQYSLGLPINDYGKKDTAVYLATQFGLDLFDDIDLALELGYSLDTDDKKDIANKALGDTSYYFASLKSQFDLTDEWSINLGYAFQKFTNGDGFDKAASQNINLAGNWQASEAMSLSVYADYDVSGKSDRRNMLGTELAGNNGDKNRWGMGARLGVQF